MEVHLAVLKSRVSTRLCSSWLDFTFPLSLSVYYHPSFFLSQFAPNISFSLWSEEVVVLSFTSVSYLCMNAFMMWLRMNFCYVLSAERWNGVHSFLFNIKLTPLALSIQHHLYAYVKLYVTSMGDKFLYYKCIMENKTWILKLVNVYIHCRLSMLNLIPLNFIYFTCFYWLYLFLYFSFV